MQVPTRMEKLRFFAIDGIVRYSASPMDEGPPSSRPPSLVNFSAGAPTEGLSLSMDLSDSMFFSCGSTAG